MLDEMPEAYRLGWIPFLGLTITLGSRPLIPRVETEYWTEKLVEEMQKREGQLRFLDLCAGSGAIGCAVLKNIPNAHVSFGEIDAAHEATIAKNIKENGLDASRTEVRIGDLFVPFAGKQFDFIAANPPYIPEGRELPASVADYEPALALRSGADGLELMRRIAKELKTHLAPGGQAWVEMDAPAAQEAAELFCNEGFAVEILPDQYQEPRTLVISYS